MTTATTTGCVAGVFRDRERAGEAVSSLVDGGFARSDIGVLTEVPEELRTEERAGTGVGSRRLIAGGVLGAVGGIALEATVLAIPGAGPFLTGGALAAALMGASAGAAAGAISGSLVRMGLRDEDAAAVEELVRTGAILVTVSARDRIAQERARLSMRARGAVLTTQVGESDDAPTFIQGFSDFVGPLRSHFDRTYAPRREEWRTWEPRYRYGWQLANRPDMAGRSWTDALSDIRAEWETRHPDVPWGIAAPAIERGWRSLKDARDR